MNCRFGRVDYIEKYPTGIPTDAPESKGNLGMAERAKGAVYNDDCIHSRAEFTPSDYNIDPPADSPFSQSKADPCVFYRIKVDKDNPPSVCIIGIYVDDNLRISNYPELDYSAKLLAELKVIEKLEFTVNEDNVAAIIISYAGAGRTSKSKHFHVRFDYLKQLLEDGTITMRHCRTQDMIADYLTKGMVGETFTRLTTIAMGRGL